jgi:hypothetical protein
LPNVLNGPENIVIGAERNQRVGRMPASFTGDPVWHRATKRSFETKGAKTA